jgi:hypothetical protein
MSELKTNKISTNDQNNVAIDNALGLKSYDTAGRDALTSVAGDMIYNSTESKVQVYTGSAWEDLGGLSLIEIDYVVVAGGGGAAFGYTGGGGAGGLLSSVSQSGGTSNTPLPKKYFIPSTDYRISVGGGGAGSSNSNGYGSTRGTSSFLEYDTAVGGGNTFGNNGGYGHFGGSGGGDNYNGNPVENNDGIANQGNSGGPPQTQASSDRGGASGGGGAGAPGQQAPNQDNGGNGGVGVYCNILTTTQATAASVGEVSGSDVYFSGGGGGSIGVLSTGSPGLGGLGGGSDGVKGAANATNATANTGGGGGGTGTGTGANGGSGVVIIKYPDTYTMSGGSGLTIVTPSSPPSGYTLKVFTAGTGTISFS